MAAESRRRRFGTIRVRVTALATVAVAIVLVVASVLLVARQRAGLVDQLDETLSTEAERIADVLESGGALPDTRRRRSDRGRRRRRWPGDRLVGRGRRIRAARLPATTTNGARHLVRRRHVSRRVGLVRHARLEARAPSTWPASRRRRRRERCRTDGVVGVDRAARRAGAAAVVWMVVGRTLRPVERIRARGRRHRCRRARPSGARTGRRRRDRPARRHDERDARTARTIGPTPAAVRRRRVPRAAHAADADACRARSR